MVGCQNTSGVRFSGSVGFLRAYIDEIKRALACTYTRQVHIASFFKLGWGSDTYNLNKQKNFFLNLKQNEQKQKPRKSYICKTPTPNTWGGGVLITLISLLISL